MKLNTAHFTKVKVDKDSTTMKHKDGHELKIAHSTLSPKVRAQLAALPLAEGGEVKDPTQEHLLPGDSTPNKIEKEVVSKAKHDLDPRLAEGGPVKGNPKLEESKKEPHNSSKYGMPGIAHGYAEGGAILKENYAEGGGIGPCMNPNCKSQGKPHPNCRCYIGMAKGGEAEHYCSKPRKHGSECEYYAEGGKAEPSPEPSGIEPVPQEDAPARLVAASESTPPSGVSYDPKGVAFDSQRVAPAAEEESEPTQPQQENPKVIPNPAAGPEDASEPPTPESAPKAEQNAPPPDPKQELDAEAAAHEHDLAMGHIKPETYSSLFAKKDTLGKIGTIFGMLASGAGSGITGQPNALMQLMQKQIDNDLEAQKASAANAQNFLRLNQENKLRQSQGNKLDAESSIISTTNAANQATQAAFHKLIDDTNSLPEGPAKQMRQQILGQMYSQMQGVIRDRNDKAAGMIAYANMLSGSPESGNQPGEQQFQNQMKAWRLSGDPALMHQADVEEARHIPGIPGKASKPVEQKDRDQIQAMNVLDNKAADLLAFAKAHKGTLSPSQRAIGTQKAEEMISFYNQSLDKGILTQGRLKWLDEQIGKHPTSVFQDILGNNARLSEIKNSNSMRKNLLLKSYGFPVKESAAPQQQSLSSQQQKFLDWAKSNPDNPKAKIVLQKLGQ